MDLFEYQGKQLLSGLGVPVPAGYLAKTAAEAAESARVLGGRVVVKAQVQVGGRGKAGGIKPASNPAQAEDAAAAILGMDIKGHRVRSVWVEAATDITAEYYAAFTLDRSLRQHLGMVSARGGMDIEAVAATDPAALVRLGIDPVLGLTDWQARQLVYAAKLDPAACRPAAAMLRKLYAAFVALDCDLLEVNPLVLSGERVIALDAKLSIDDNALYRHPEFSELMTAFEVDPIEAMAKAKGLGFIKLDGSVGIIGNGAGLVMATLDVLALVGGQAANFLDVGGGANADTILTAIEVLVHDPTVKVALINIFGGITRCDLVAEGILEALARLQPTWPIVVRLDGTNAAEAREKLAAAGSNRLVPAATMRQAAELASALAKGV